MTVERGEHTGGGVARGGLRGGAGARGAGGGPPGAGLDAAAARRAARRPAPPRPEHAGARCGRGGQALHATKKTWFKIAVRCVLVAC